MLFFVFGSPVRKAHTLRPDSSECEVQVHVFPSGFCWDQVVADFVCMTNPQSLGGR